MTAEQIRRGGNPAAAMDLCRDALARFPGHLSARVTLGWALLDLGRLQEAREEFQIVRQTAPDNFAAIRGLAQLHVLDENDSSYTPEVEAAAPEPSAPADVTPPTAPKLAIAPVAAPVPPVAVVAPPAQAPVFAQEVPSASPVVMRLESWLSRVEALRAAV